jgi:hypothetical protein
VNPDQALRIHPDVTAEEVAAILAVLAGSASGRAGKAAGPEPAATWRQGSGLRATRSGAGSQVPGPDAWRTSSWPR